MRAISFGTLCSGVGRLKGVTPRLTKESAPRARARPSLSLQRAATRAKERLLPPAARLYSTVRTRLPLASLIVCALALLGCGLVGALYLQGEREAELLRAQLHSARRELRRLGTEASRRERLTDALTTLATVREYFPQTLDGVQVLEKILLLAQASGVQVSDVKTRPIEEQKVGQHKYSALSVSLRVEGTVSGLQAFLDGLEKGYAGAVSLSNVDVGRIDGSPVASLTLSAYARQ